jgi:YD repeat-containing protein
VGTFSYIYGGNIPSNGSWQATSSATNATAYMYCTPPPVPPAQTYGNGSSYDSVNPSGYQAEPVNTATGAYSTTQTDAQLAGIGVPFSFVRSYTSSNTYSGPLGTGWTDSMNVFLSGATQSQVTLYSENGQQTSFTGAGNGAYTAPPGTRSVLTDASGGGWLLIRQNQDHLAFNSSGQLTSATDRHGIGLSMSYNASGLLASVTDYAGRTIAFSYNASGLLTQMNFPPGRSVTYSYTSTGQLASVTDAAGGVTSYTYKTSGLLATITDQNGHQVVNNTYNSSGQVTAQVNALGKKATFSYNTSTQTCTYTDPDGHKWQDLYSGDTLIERIDPLGHATTYSYDSNLDLAAVTNADGNTATMTYDASGNMLTKIAPYPISATQTWGYDALNDVTSYTDADGNETAYSYDAKGNLVSEALPDQSTIPGPGMRRLAFQRQ